MEKPNAIPVQTSLNHILKNCDYKAILLYLVPQNENPHQNCIELLREMASQGILCLVCCHWTSKSTGEISSAQASEMLQENLYLLQEGLSVVPVFRNLSALVLSTAEIHPDLKQLLSHKFLWFHSNLPLEIPSPKESSPFKQADLITYFAANNQDSLKAEKPGHPSSSLSFDHGESKILELKPGDPQQNANLITNSLRTNPKGWPIYANLNLQGKIAVMTATFFDFEGEFFYSGGAERYLLDLANLCEELGKELMVFQYGNYPWLRRFKNIDVVSLSRGGHKVEGWLLKCLKDFNRIFYELVQDRTVLNIYSAFFEAWPVAATPNIGISHGVAWDNPLCAFENAIEFWVMNERHIQGAKACEELVSVDTNSANWFQTIDFDLGQRTKVIPNYVDLTQFKPTEGYLTKKEKKVILYPRQLYAGRGLDLVLAVMDDILEKFPDVEFHFAGRGGEDALALVQEKQKNWPGRVKYQALAMEEMPQVYQEADISIIPTVHSEGTSLSCLEAMASGNGVIATRVGGLSDLIINNYNGLLIDPHAEALKRALIDLLEDNEKLNTFKQRNRDVAQAFAKEIWQDRWTSLLKKKLDLHKESVPPKVKKARTVEIRLLNHKENGLDKENKEYSTSLGEYITQLLIEGCIVYLRTPSVPDPSLSFDRIQWLAADSPLFTPCDLTITW